MVLLLCYFFCIEHRGRGSSAILEGALQASVSLDVCYCFLHAACMLPSKEQHMPSLETLLVASMCVRYPAHRFALLLVGMTEGALWLETSAHANT